MTDYKSEFINKCILDLAYLQDSERKKIYDILVLNLNGYDIYPNEMQKQLPATVEDYNEMLVKLFLAVKRVESLSDKSLKLYALRLRQYLDRINKKVTDMQSTDIRAFLLLFKTERNVSNTTLESIRLSLSSFYVWLFNENYIQKNPMQSIAPIKKDTYKEKPFSQTEIEALRIACTNSRDRALIEFLLSTGCRVSEAISVNKDQINATSKELLVIGKGNKERKVYLSDKALVYINIYLKERTDNADALFVKARGEHTRLTKDGVASILKTIGKQAGIKDVHPHRFRRTMCCGLIDKGMSLQNVQQIMGHSSINTTMIYYNANQNSIKSEFDKINNI